MLGLALQCSAVGFDGGGSGCVSRISGVELGELGWFLGQCCILKALYLCNDGRERLPAHLTHVVCDLAHHTTSANMFSVLDFLRSAMLRLAWTK